VRIVDGVACAAVERTSPGMAANIHYFSHPRWMAAWLARVHRGPALKARWLAAAGPWDGKVVVDIGCGPGNLFATLGGAPAVLIGVDIALGSLELARAQGYEPLLADAHDLPLRGGIADLVALNATVHHCDDMARVVAEAARLVAPGGWLVIDHDPHRPAWELKGLGRLLWDLRLPLYRLLGRPGHSRSDDEQQWALASELHHRPGDGVSDSLFRGVLEPLGFDVDTYPHNQTVGAEALHGAMGRAPWRIRLAQRLSGVDPTCPTGAITLMCCAERRLTET
jgi:SAM-dependent methyltransferase